MDSPHLSRAIVEELGAVFVAAVEQAGPTLLTADLDEIEQHLQAVGRRVWARVVEQTVAARRGRSRRAVRAVGSRCAWSPRRGSATCKDSWVSTGSCAP